MFYTKYFARKLVTISCKLFFLTKFVNISYKKNFKTKLIRNMSFFSNGGGQLRQNPWMIIEPHRLQSF